MRLAYIGQKGIFLPKDGGVERHVEDLSLKMAEKNHEVFVYTRPRYMPFKKRKHKNINLIYLPTIPTKNLDAIVHTFLSTLHVLFKKVDIIHYHGVGPSTLSWIPRLLKRKSKVVVTFHSQDKFHKKWGWFARKYLGFGEWTACHFPHQTIVVSHSLQRYCKKKFKKNVLYIPNAISFEEGEGTDKIGKWGLKKDSYILTVARLIKHKGIHYLIQAFHKIEGETDKKLIIVGAPSYTDDYYEYLTKLAQESTRIVFTGYQTGKTLAQLFQNAYLYIHPSESEGLSITILEAMSFGKCVLMSDIPENLEMIDHSGISFHTGQTEDLKNKLLTLLNHPEIIREREKKAKEFIRKNFCWDKIADQIEKVYKKLYSQIK